MEYKQDCKLNFSLDYYNVTTQSAVTSSSLNLKTWQVSLIVLLGFGGFAMLLSVGHYFIRKYIYRDQDRVDTAFDAGGNVTLSLTAASAASQLFWPADLLQSATVTTKYGVAGAFWYAVGVVVNIVLFPLLSVHFKSRAPGAKTFLQVIQARFGKNAHIVSIVFALATNCVVLTCLILAGTATMTAIADDMSPEYAVILMAFLFGSYTLVGGLGATFYVSYFNCVLIYLMLLIVTLNVYYIHHDDSIGSLERLYDKISCVFGPEGNEGNSVVTFRSSGAIIFGIISIFLASAVVFCDQASWQMRIAAKPMQGVIGFFIGGLIWFAIPIPLTTTTGLIYLSESIEQGAPLLTDTQVDEGLVSPLILHKLFGVFGEVMILAMVCMALMSTGSGEIMAISSIIVYDIYQVYFNPYRSFQVAPNQCILCLCTYKTGSEDHGNKTEFCSCEGVKSCEACCNDDTTRSLQKSAVLPDYTCKVHGEYKKYQDILRNLKAWCIVWVTVAIVPMGLVINNSGINLNWAFQSGAVSTISCFPTVVLSVMWSKTTGAAVIAGNLLGLLVGYSSMVGLASTYPGGLENMESFVRNTAQETSVLVGCCFSFGISLFTCIGVSIVTNCKANSDNDCIREWDKTLAIDNPLYPWVEQYENNLTAMNIEYHHRPSFRQMEQLFKGARNAAYIGGTCFILIFLIVLPGILMIMPYLEFHQFQGWITFSHVFMFIMALFVFIVPPAQEIINIRKEYRDYIEPREQEIGDSAIQNELL
ncbi:unnamed protein product [Owenia fusiformis]|uniref:Urea-proton symporter DUR3 n=1 Tax=Owenia fusiformis TaxID=6347 RepID=A0A8S4P5V1_OWEFU|nr:unnamed protein product [Owenia fusiformis]